MPALKLLLAAMRIPVGIAELVLQLVRTIASSKDPKAAAERALVAAAFERVAARIPVRKK